MNTENEYPKIIINAIAEIRDKIGTVHKDSTNEHFHYKYVSEREMQAAVRPLLKEFGLVIIPSASPHTSLSTDHAGYFNYMAAFQLCHTDGSVWPDLIYVPAQDKGDKAAWKANTGAMKYLLNRLFMLDTGDDPEGKDDSSEKPEFRKPPQQDTTQYSPPPQSSGGRTLKKGHPLLTSQFWGAAFGASEAAHGKDAAMKFLAIERSCKELGYNRMGDVPENQFDELFKYIKSYPIWWNKDNEPPVDDTGGVF
jgi:hypothetical protein